MGRLHPVGQKDTQFYVDVAFRPQSTCVPACNFNECGDDGCGGLCGVCSNEHTCSSGQCVLKQLCVPDCLGKLCGDDGCGGLCGVCQYPLMCGADNQCASSAVDMFAVANPPNVNHGTTGFELATVFKPHVAGKVTHLRLHMHTAGSYKVLSRLFV